MSNLILRPAKADDLQAVNEIFNHYVLNCTCTFVETPLSNADRQAWHESHGGQDAGLARKFPAIVAVDAGEVVGFATLSPFHTRCAYRHTVENSVYVRPDAHGRGIGSMLLGELIELGRTAGHHSIVALICAEQTASLALHEKFGFVEVGRLKEVGNKFNRWLDVAYMQLML